MALLCLFLTLLCHDLYAQLPAFNVTVTAIPQTCLGNGGLTFTTSGTTTGASLDYAVYLLPNTTTPVTTVTSPSANGLVAGTYQVVATQTLGNQSNTVTATATIADNVVPLSYTLKTAPCGDNGTITVQVTSGTAQSYEIISGPETKPLQTSNIFTGLPLGLYSVRVHDVCGDAVVVDVNLQALPVYLFMSDKILPDVPLPTCNKITVGHSIGNNYPMLFPVTLTFTVYPPNGGTPVVVTKTVNNYSGDQIEYVDIPYYSGYYSYDVKMADACGNELTINSFVDKQFDFELSPKTVSCNNFMLNIDMSVYKLPCTVSFLSAPVGFNPSLFNASHPVFDYDSITYGTDNNPIPLGDYTVKITDACGHTATHNITITDEGIPLVDAGIGNLSSCYGYFTITMPFNRNIASAVITVAPDKYDVDLPQNVMQFVNGGTLTINDIPVGSYTVVLTDICGVEYTVPIEIIETSGNPSLSSNMLPGCSGNEGSIYLYSYDYRLTSLIITSAPSAYTNPLPYDASMDIDNQGAFRTNSLPVGTYTVQGIDDCDNETVYQFNIDGYEVLNDHIEIVPGCGSFDIILEYLSSNTFAFAESFWLQQYDEVTGKWKDPLYGYTYQEGDPLVAGNALQLNNNATNYTLPYSGKFRVMRYFYIYADQQTNDEFYEDCITPIYEFTYYDNPHINGAYGFTCGDGTSDVILDAQGLAPLTYEITTKNGEPFALNNGTLNFFQGLENGTYTFRVTDSCNNFLNIQYDISVLQPFDIQSSGLCDGQAGSLNVQGFSFLTYEWWKNTDPATILSTANTLDFETFDSVDQGTYSLHITTTLPGSCINETLTIQAVAQSAPLAGIDTTISICNDGLPLDLNQYLQQPFDDGGVWTDSNATGKLQQNMLYINGLVAGTYNFKYTVTNSCNSSDEAIITLNFKPSPEVPLVAVDGVVCDGGTLLLSASSIDNASYNWTGPNGFTSNEQNPVVQNVSASYAGIYTLNIIVEGIDCPSVPVAVTAVVNNIPEFEIGGSTNICQGKDAVLLIVPQNFESSSVVYKWYYNGELSEVTGQNVHLDQPGVYKVIVDNNGCIAEKEITITESNFTVSLESGCVEGAYIINMISDTDLSDAEIVWTGPGDYKYSGAKANITNLKAGEYKVAIASPDGCSASQSIEIESTNCGDIPKGVSPNGDNLNDTFDLSNFDVKELKIFNRYGLIIYKAGNYKKEWHGQTDNGNEAPTGVYYYVVTQGTGEQRTGWVYLQRQE